MKSRKKSRSGSSIIIFGKHVPRVHRIRVFHSPSLLKHTAPTAVNIIGEVSEKVCVALYDCLATKHSAIQTEVQASKTKQTYQYTWTSVPQAPSYQVLMSF